MCTRRVLTVEVHFQNPLIFTYPSRVAHLPPRGGVTGMVGGQIDGGTAAGDCKGF